jgi:predicted small secreted protein
MRKDRRSGDNPPERCLGTAAGGSVGGRHLVIVSIGGASGAVDRAAPSRNGANPGRTVEPPKHTSHPAQYRRTLTMRKTVSIALMLLTLMSAASLLGACHATATAGAGEDISATGDAITHSADQQTP